MGIKEISTERKDIFMVDPDKLIEDPSWNVRVRTPELKAHIRWLADSIKDQGVKEPLTIWMNNGVPTVSNGHCRLLAVKIAKGEGSEIKTVPVRLEERYSSEGDRILSLIIRNSGKPLEPLETAEVVKRLRNFGWSNKEIASKTGYSLAQIGNFLNMSSWGQDLKKPIEEGKVSASLMQDEVREKGQEGAARAVDGALKKTGKKRVTRRDVSRKVNWKVWGPKFVTIATDVADGISDVHLRAKALLRDFEESQEDSDA